VECGEGITGPVVFFGTSGVPSPPSELNRTVFEPQFKNLNGFLVQKTHSRVIDAVEVLLLVPEMLQDPDGVRLDGDCGPDFLVQK
jgi:hypothetical protein